MPKTKVSTSKNVSNTKKQVVRNKRQKAVNVGNGVEKKQQKWCHQCGGKKDGVIDCKKCGLKRYCVDCKTKWYPDVSEEKFVKACPVCKDSNETEEAEGTYRGHAVGVAEKKLLQAFELQYPKAFEWHEIGSATFWLGILKELCALVKGILETSVEELVEQEQITRLEEQLRGLKNVGFDLSWIEKRLNMVKELRFGDYPLSQDLLVLQESVEPLKEEMNERQRQYIEAQQLFEKVRIKYDAAKKSRNKLNEMTQKYGDELILTGSLGSGMLPGT